MDLKNLDLSNVDFEIDNNQEILKRFLKRMNSWREMKKSLKNSPPKSGSRMGIQRTSAERDLLSFLEICREILGVSDEDFFKIKNDGSATIQIGNRGEIKERFKQKVAQLVVVQHENIQNPKIRILDSAVNETRWMLNLKDNVFADLKSQIREKCIIKKNNSNWFQTIS